MSIDGKLQDGSMEIDAGNNLETFKMGSGAEEAIEVNDFQNVSIFHAFRSLTREAWETSHSGRRSAPHTHPNGKELFFLAAMVPLTHLHRAAYSL